MKILFATLTLLITLTSSSQIQYGIFAGPIATTARYTINDSIQDNSFKYGFQLGFTMKVPFENRLSFSPSLQYNLRGYKVKFNTNSIPPDINAIDNNTTFHTIEAAFLLQHDFTTTDGHWFFRIGPSLDFALFGKEEFNTTTSATVKRNMKFSFTDYGHYLAAAIFQLGYESPGGTFIYGHYNYGLTTMSNYDYGPVIGNRAVGITIGRYFGRNKIVMDTRNKE